MQKKKERKKKRQIQAVYHQYKSIPRIAIIKTVHNFIASFLLEHHKDKSYFLHSGCPIKKGGDGARKREVGRRCVHSHLRVSGKKEPPRLSYVTPSFHLFLGPAVNSMSPSG